MVRPGSIDLSPVNVTVIGSMVVSSRKADTRSSGERWE